eukprot:SAG22_NODE_411_length_10900_cov_2.633738_2_plen_891_part_00
MLPLELCLRQSLSARSVCPRHKPCSANPGCVSKAIVIGAAGGKKTTVADKGAYYLLSAGQPSASSVTLRADKGPSLLFSMYSGSTLLWKETAPLSWNASTTSQTLQAGLVSSYGPTSAHFFGGGMQNSHFAHKGNKIDLKKNFDWGPTGSGGGSVPFYVSSAGFGCFRNTWAPGTYDFSSVPVVLGHNESRYDAYFFAGDFAAALDGYTQLTGRPFLPPLYALGLGDSDCYHDIRHDNSTKVVIGIADMYRAMDMPGSWFLVNDGYGCGYGETPFTFPNGTKTFPHDFADLDFTVAQLHERGFYTGLWSSTGLPNIAREVGGSGTRIAKTDVGWVGNGDSQYTFDSVQVVADGIEDNSDGRRYIWSVCGWAGSQRNAVLWTGDDSGSFEFIRWQLTTFVGTGFSGMAHVSGDVDGIFGGSAETYVRDLQFKCMMTTLMTMSGWAANPDKQPWTYGEPFTSINRMYLKLKASLAPYQYSYSRLAAETGMPPVRAMALQFPDDMSTYENTTGTAYQFMSGDYLLVAPVYRNTTVRDGIYLPAGDWIDWWDDSVHTGPETIDGYPAPLDKLPLFVRAGAIIPMWPPMLYFGEKKADPMTLELYPGGNSSFTLYEDDGVTRNATVNGHFLTTEINMAASANFSTLRKPDVTVSVSAAVGKGFDGAATVRSWILNVHTDAAPLTVTLKNGTGSGMMLPEYHSLPSVDYSTTGGWYFSRLGMGKDYRGKQTQKNKVYIRLPPMATDAGFEVVVSSGALSDHVGMMTCSTVVHRQVEPQEFQYDATTGLIVQLGKSPEMCVTVGRDKEPDSQTPAIEMQPCEQKSGHSQRWNLTDSGQIALAMSPKQCMDTDATDKMLEVYSCHSPQSAGNQAFEIDPTTKHIIAKESGLCMFVRNH